MQLALDHWHIEPSSICTLACPRCPRAEVPETLLNRQLDLQFFVNQIGADMIKKIKRITFCGNDGDPIYCKQFLEICDWIKTVNPNMQLLIVTNGSYKKSSWWQKLAEILNTNDEINWSIDGWDQKSNEMYRQRCDFESIINGIEVFSNHNHTTYKTWATIAFKFNQNNLDDIEKLAKTHGFDCWQLTKSTKFGNVYPTYGDDDPLQPVDDLIAKGHRFEREQHYITSKARPGIKQIFQQRTKKLRNSNEYPAICYIGNKGVFLNAMGEFYPCCWTANRYEHNKQWIELGKSRFNLYNYTIEQIIQDEFWNNEFLKFDSFECKTKCTKHALQSDDHAVNW
jgi:MoaA/NifB/PqqE/SkfB family radical SAM enzyme